jgi:hypothetical protein
MEAHCCSSTCRNLSISETAKYLNGEKICHTCGNKKETEFIELKDYGAGNNLKNVSS